MVKVSKFHTLKKERYQLGQCQSLSAMITKCALSGKFSDNGISYATRMHTHTNSHQAVIIFKLKVCSKKNKF